MIRRIKHKNCYLDIDQIGKKTFCMQENKNINFTLIPLYEFALQIESEDFSGIITSEMCEKEYLDSENILCTVYHHPAFDMTVRYTIEQAVVYKKLQMLAKRDLNVKYAQTEISRTGAKLTRGGEGQPIFLGRNAFISIVFPAAQNYIDCDTLRLEQAPFISLSKGDTFDFFNVVFGFNTSETLEQTFIDYIDRHKKQTPPGLRIYCDWGAHDEMAGEDILNETLALKMLKQLQCAGKNGVDFDYYLMDAYWFQEEDFYKSFKHKTWPEGNNKFLSELEKMGLKFGLWFDVNMGCLKLPDKSVKNNGDSNRLCIGYEENMKILFDGIKEQTEKCGCTMLKLDFAYFDCSSTDHSVHAAGGVKSKEPAIRNFLKGLQSLYETDSKLIVIGYNGFTTDLKYISSVDPNNSGYALSPWWCLYLDYIYCGDPRPSEIPAEKLSTSLVYYSDSMIEQYEKSLIPYKAIDDHGTMIGETNTIYYLGREVFHDSWIMNISRGGRKQHLYGNIELLGGDDWAFIKKSNEMFSFVCEKNNKTQRIIGSPLRKQVYGYSNSDGKKGYITLVNCRNTKETVCVRLEDWKDKETERIHKVYYKKAFVEEDYEDITGAFTVKLEPGEVTVFQWEIESISDMLQEGYVILDGNSSELLTFPEATSYFTLQLTDENASPQRIFGRKDEPFKAECIQKNVSLERINTNPIWSGCSWISYRVSGNGRDKIKVRLYNSSDKRLYVKWSDR